MFLYIMIGLVVLCLVLNTKKFKTRKREHQKLKEEKSLRAKMLLKTDKSILEDELSDENHRLTVLMANRYCPQMSGKCQPGTCVHFCPGRENVWIEGEFGILYHAYQPACKLWGKLDSDLRWFKKGLK